VKAATDTEFRRQLQRIAEHCRELALMAERRERDQKKQAASVGSLMRLCRGHWYRQLQLLLTAEALYYFSLVFSLVGLRFGQL
jgi:hypothetical protein